MAIRSKTGSVTETRRALQHFTNRKISIRHFAGYLNEDPARERILFFHGDGGNGKTLLLRFLKEKCCQRLDADNWGYVKSLEGNDFIENFAGAVACAEVPSTLIDFGMKPRGNYIPKEAFSALMKMRRDLSGGGLRFPLYDFACTLYLYKTGRLTPDRLQEFFPSEEMDFVKEAIDLIKEFPGTGLVKAVFGFLNKRLRDEFTLYMNARMIDEEQVQQMKSMDPESDLYELFPILFAEDLNASMTLKGAPQRVVLFFDTHEAFWEVDERKFSDEKYFLEDEWLRRLLSTLELSRGIVVVVAGREEPRWAEAAKWDIPPQHTDTHLVGGLSFADAAHYLEKVEILDKEMRESLITYAQIKPDEIHPLYLGLCADIVLAAKHSGKEITAEEFREIPDVDSKGKELMNCLRKYVDRTTEYAISALSACRSFDRDLYVSLMEGLKLGFSREGFDYLAEFSFVWDSEDRGEGWYRVHDLMRRLAYERKDPTTIEAHQFLVKYYRSLGGEGDITAIAERVYHVHRLDLEDGINQWLAEMEQALKLSKYDLCRALLGIRNELFLSDDFSRGSVSAQEGDYYATLSLHQNALIEYREAITAYEEALSRTPDDAKIHNNKGTELNCLGDLQAKLSQHYEASQSYAQAIAAYDEALRRSPDEVKIHNNKGGALHSLGKLQAGLSQHDVASKSYARAITSFDEALRTAPDYVNAHNNKGLSLQSLGKLQATLSQHYEASQSYTQAIASYDEALRRTPDEVKIHNNKGLALQCLGELQARLSQHDEASKSYARAITAYDEALRIAPDDVSVHNNKGIALGSLGMLQAELSQHDEASKSYARAIAAFDEALRTAPDYVTAHNNKGLLLQSLGDLQARLSQHYEASQSYAQAVATYDEALRTAPDTVTIHNNKGIALGRLGELLVRFSQHDEASKIYAWAIAAFDEALRTAPDDVSALNNKGLALQSLGDLQARLSQHDEASKSYQSAVAVYSRSLEIARAQENICKRRDSIQQILDKKRI